MQLAIFSAFQLSWAGFRNDALFNE